MVTSQENKQITMEEALEMPELAHLHEAIRYVQTTPFKKMFPNKYKALVEDSVLQKTYELFEKSPDMPLKNVVSTVLAHAYDDSISAELILQMTQLIIQKWVHLSTPIYENKGVEEMV